MRHVRSCLSACRLYCTLVIFNHRVSHRKTQSDTDTVKYIDEKIKSYNCDNNNSDEYDDPHCKFYYFPQYKGDHQDADQYCPEGDDDTKEFHFCTS